MSIVCPHCNKEINAGYLLTTQKKQVKKTCKICNKTFLGAKNAKFCSNACRCKEYQRKKKQQIKQRI